MQSETTTFGGSQFSPAATLQALLYEKGSLKVLNQLLLPHQFQYDDCSNSELGFEAIKSMRVRGAPAIALAAALSLAAEVFNHSPHFKTGIEASSFIFQKLQHLQTSRPTAVNLADAVGKLASVVKGAENAPPQVIVDTYIAEAERLFAADISDNKSIGRFGAEIILNGLAQHLPTTQGLNTKQVSILTHCNTGSLATASYGTALGIIRALHEQKRLEHAYCTETRPYNQGARLTAFELVYEKIPATLITDSMAAFLMLQRNIDAVVVGADRVVNNGDTANKIGTYQLAIAARYHKIPFYVAAPVTSFDTTLQTGAQIPIEQRPPHELTDVAGVRIAAQGIGVWNPGFDITPGALISGIVTERGVILPNNTLGGYDLFNQLKHFG